MVGVARTAEQLYCHGEAERPRGIHIHMVRHQASVVRVAVRQHIQGFLRGRRRAGAKAHRALMIDEGVAGKPVMPAARAGTQAEVVFSP